MKKNYLKPELSTINVEVCQVIADSIIKNSSDGLTGNVSGQGTQELNGGSVDASQYRSGLWN